MKHKKQILKTILLLLMPAFTVAQQYHPFPEENAFWTVVEFDQQIWAWETYIYTVKGDTLLNDKTYKKIYKLNDIPDSSDTLWTLHSFMRQEVDNKKVFFIRHYLSETIEKLGYDFDVVIGDTVHLPAFDYENIGDSIFEVIDPGDDSTQLWNGEYRKNYSYASLYPDIGLDPYVIEGIGTQRTPFPNLFFFDAFHQSEMVCHKVNNIYLYGASPLPDECGFTVGIHSNQEITNYAVKPNPCDAYLLVTLSGNFFGEIELQFVNLFGVVVLRQKMAAFEKEVKINTSFLTNGLYLLNLKTKSQTYSKQKIIINH